MLDLSTNELDRNLRILQTAHRGRPWNTRAFQIGGFVALPDGPIVAVEQNAGDAIAALRGRDPDPKLGMSASRLKPRLIDTSSSHFSPLLV